MVLKPHLTCSFKYIAHRSIQFQDTCKDAHAGQCSALIHPLEHDNISGGNVWHWWGSRSGCTWGQVWSAAEGLDGQAPAAVTCITAI